MTLNSFYGSIDLSIRAVFRRIFFLDTAFLIEKIVMIFIKVLKNMQKEIGFLEREMERPRDKVSAKKILLAILAVCIMSAAIIGGTVKKPETKQASGTVKGDKRGCGTKWGQSLSGNGTYLLCSVGRLCE